MLYFGSNWAYHKLISFALEKIKVLAHVHLDITVVTHATIHLFVAPPLTHSESFVERMTARSLHLGRVCSMKRHPTPDTANLLSSE